MTNQERNELHDLTSGICEKYTICSNGCPFKTEAGYMCNNINTARIIYSSLFNDQFYSDITENDIVSIFNDWNAIYINTYS